ncbi:MAG: O-antigen ligase family protein [Lachnospiraceae bacterium]|nr:O-antigen ligase family protein [Lachnospiraceae bacterium]
MNSVISSRIKLKDFIDMLLAAICCVSCTLLVHINNSLYKILIVLFCVLAMLVCARRKVKIEKLGFVVRWAVFVSWSLISFVWSYQITEYQFNSAIVFLLILVTCFVVSIYIESAEQVYLYFRMLIFSAILLEIYIFKFYGENMLDARFDNTVLNSNRAGIIFAVALFFCVYFYDYYRKLMDLILALFLCAGVLFSGSKSAILFTIFSVGIFMILKNRKDISNLIRNIMIVVAFILIIFFIITKSYNFYNIIGERLIDFLGTLVGKQSRSVSTIMRTYFLEQGIELFKERPLQGWGIYNFRYLNKYGDYAHSNIIEILADFGIVGAIFFVRIYTVIIKKMLHNKNMVETDRAFVWAYMVGMLFLNFTHVYMNQLFDIIIACLLYLFVVLNSNTDFKCKKSIKK